MTAIGQTITSWTRCAPTARRFALVLAWTVLLLAVPALAQEQTTAGGWSIGIYRGTSPFSIAQPSDISNPVLTASSVTDVPARFVADPFLLKDNGTWYLFMEVLNDVTARGEIAVATSSDGVHWRYQQIVLAESFHLSYPYVFKSGSDYYMIPEAGGSNSVRLYKATNFPYGWTLVSTLLSGANFVDNSIAFYNNKWWLFTTPDPASNSALRLYYADALAGPYTQHPLSPIVPNDSNIARGGGRLLVYNGGLYRYTQDCNPTYGNLTRAYQITDITTLTYAETPVPQNPVIKSSGFGWTRDGMHTVDPVEVTPGAWIAAVDGLGDPSVLVKTGWQVTYQDSQQVGNEATRAIDGSANTIWHSKWSGTPDPLPHEIRLDLQANYEMHGFRYLPRQDGGTQGMVKAYEIYVSADGTNWGTAVATGAFGAGALAQDVEFEPVIGRYVRFRALSSQGGDPYTAAAELDVAGNLFVGNHSPQGTINQPTGNVQINVGDAVNFAGTGTDSDGDVLLSYHWDFGKGSGVTPSTLRNPGLVHYYTAGTYTVNLIVTDSLGLADPNPAQVVVTVVDPAQTVPLDRTNWHVVYVDSQETIGENGAATNVIDNRTNTIWHTRWLGGAAPLPHEIQVDLGGFFNVQGFRYLPRQDGGLNGRIGQYEFYVSEDGVAWGSPVASGTFANDAAEKQIRFNTVLGHYVRLRALTSANGDPYTSMAELNVLGTNFTGNRAPNGTITAPASDVTIAPGQSVTFTGTGNDPDNNVPLTYLWNFGVGSNVSNSTSASPGAVTFTDPGTYVVSFTVTDALGLADATPATRTVTVTNASPPNGTIDTPVSDVTINAGQSVSFAGTGTDPGGYSLTYRWNFGAGSGVPDATVEDPGSITFTNPGIFVVTFTVTNALGMTDATPATRTVTVLANAPIGHAGWVLRYVDSQETAGENAPATNSFDGRNTTLWHTKWAGGADPLPHEIQIDLGGSYSMNGFRYLPRQDGGVNGRVANYQFYTSVDGVTWGTPVATGTFADDATEKEVRFGAVIGRYIRFRALSSTNGGPYTSMAEINVLGGSANGSNQAPNGVIDAPLSSVTINVGSSVTFLGTGTDPDGNLPVSYRWNFGAGSNVPDSTLEDPGAVTFNTPGTFTVTFTVTDALGLADPSPDTRVITVVDPNAATPLPRNLWSIVYVDSQELSGENGAAANALDGNNGTIWHTQWSGGSPAPPHEIQVDMGLTNNVSGFRYLPRQDGSTNGRVAQYEFYVSNTITNWGAPVATGTFVNDATEKEVRFPTVAGRFVRFRALTEVAGRAWTTMAEFNVLGGTAPGNQAPNGTIDTPASDVTINAGDFVNFGGTGFDPDGNLPLTYRWTFGSGSGLADSTLEDPGAKQFNTPGVYVVTFTVTDGLGLADPIPATRTITVRDPNATAPLAQSQWTLRFVDSQETVGENGAAVNAFDGNPATIWHTQWLGGAPAPPHEIQIDLGATYSVNGFKYLPRQDGGLNGRVGQYEFYVSTDGVTWGTAVSTGTFVNDATEKLVSFTMTTARYVRFRALTEVQGRVYSSMAELNVLGR